MLLLQVLASASGSSTDSLMEGKHLSSFSSSAYSSSSASPPTTLSTELSSNASDVDDDLFTLSSVIIPAPPPLLSSNDERLPVSSSPSTTTASTELSSNGNAVEDVLFTLDDVMIPAWRPSPSYRVEPAPVPSSSPPASDLPSSARASHPSSTSFADSTTQLLLPVSLGRTRTTKISEEIAKVEDNIRKSMKEQEVLGEAAEVAEMFGNSTLAERVTKLWRRQVLRGVLLRRAKTMLKREAGATEEMRTVSNIARVDQHLVGSRQRLALGGRAGEGDGGSARTDRTLEWLNELPLFA